MNVDIRVRAADPRAFIELLGQFVGQSQFRSQNEQQEWDANDPRSLLKFIRVGDPHLRNDLHQIRNALGDGFATLVRRADQLRLCEAVFEQIRQYEWLYDFEPGCEHYERQRIRPFREMHADRVGTCLDFACLFAALLESMQATPVIARVVCPGSAHAVAGTWVRNIPSGAIMRNHEQVCESIRREELILFETTGAARSDEPVAGENRVRGFLSFHQARETAAKLLLSGVTRLDFLLNILAAR